MGFKLLNWKGLESDFNDPEEVLERARNSEEHKKLLIEIDRLKKEYYDNLEKETQSNNWLGFFVLLFVFELFIYKVSKMDKINLTEADLNKLIKKIIVESGYMNDMLPIEQSHSDIQLKYSVVQQILQDLYKASNFFESIKPSNDAEYIDKLNRLKRGMKNLDRATK